MNKHRQNGLRTRSTRRGSGFLLTVVLAIVTGSVLAAGPVVNDRLDYERDVRPILAENCFACHGFDANKRQAGLRLDVAEGALKPLPSGHTAIVPGQPEAGELVRRVTARSMPPEATGKRLSEAQIEVLRRWIAQGARYGKHWAFVAPKRPPLPVVKNPSWAVNPIDRFVLARLEQEGLRPSPAADRATLIRRLSLDLTGLPPTLAEVSAFLNDRRPGAYERLVDRLLSSPHYGERMALAWLDMARYADTHGYHIDSHRDMWLWRDWVIDAFNRNLPFDQFTIQQLAGDLLPNATREQKIASGFNRNHPINFEGGAIPEEYQAAYIENRIDTTATVWMGLTMKCAQCHDHKYDPVSQKEYYRFYAYFNSVTEKGLDGQKGNAVPFLKVTKPEQQARLEQCGKEIAQREQALKAHVTETASTQAAWIANPEALRSEMLLLSAGIVAHYGLAEGAGEQVRATDFAPGLRALGAEALSAGTVRGKAAWAPGKVGGALSFDGSAAVDLGGAFGFDRADKVSFGAWVYPAGKEAMTVLARMEEGSAPRGWELTLENGKVAARLVHQGDQNAVRVVARNGIETEKWSHVFVTYDGTGKGKGVRIFVNGKPAEVTVSHDTLSDTIRTERPLQIGRRGEAGAPFKGRIDEVRFYRQELTASEVEQLARFDTVRQIVATPAEKRTDDEKDALSKYYLEYHDARYREINRELAEWRKQQADLDGVIPTTMVMDELDKPRETFMLIRGQYNKPGEKVTPGTPDFLPPLPKDAPASRLGFARWLVDPSHPLTARVAVNHFWQLYFATGLVHTAEDFGTQGERPSHPELLDWLATEFIRSGWDVKAMQRLIVTSATYRQSSCVTSELLERDPENRLLARGPRFRLPAELIRDQALAVSGLLAPKLGGPPVRPYQPPGLWEEIAFGQEFTAQKYVQDHGEALYRRSMYTFWKRTCPPPALQTFDAPDREFCLVRRTTTNTPLQALVLMNDPTYVEASRKLAERLMTGVAAVPADRVRYAFRLALARPPKDAEVRVLLDVYTTQLAAFQKDKPAAEKLLAVGESKRNEKLDVAQLAAWTSVASVILNLDEVVTKG